MNLTDAFTIPQGGWREHFRSKIGERFQGRIVLEIGCFDAHFLARIASQHPQTGFVGIDWTIRSLQKGLQTIKAAGLRNIALCQSRGQEIQNLFAEGEVDEIWVFHPEPCVRIKERPNRLMCEQFLIAAHAVLRSSEAGRESALILKTDHPGYYQWTLGLFGEPEPQIFQQMRADRSMMGIAGGSKLPRRADWLAADDQPIVSDAIRERFAIRFHSADFWNDPQAITRVPQRDFANETTAYESRFVRKRQPIFYVEMQKSSRR